MKNKKVGTLLRILKHLLSLLTLIQYFCVKLVKSLFFLCSLSCILFTKFYFFSKSHIHAADNVNDEWTRTLTFDLVKIMTLLGTLIFIRSKLTSHKNRRVPNFKSYKKKID